jgi:hypothetical protein
MNPQEFARILPATQDFFSGQSVGSMNQIGDQE